ncbi:MAG TPA: DUF5615 family PIN-like protein [Polyangiaceae bacterium]|nr:DUF5615 family PIN-like protein [Polyangiaceae bacterium]
MIGLAADENLDNDIVRALRRRVPDVDIIRAQDAGLSGRDDPTILEWAASSERVLLTHDVSTMTRYALDRVRVGLQMPGLVVIPQRAAIALGSQCAHTFAGHISWAPSCTMAFSVGFFFNATRRSAVIFSTTSTGSSHAVEA